MSEKSMVETVAAAMWKAAVPDNPWETALDEDYYDGPGRDTMRKMANAAVEAMFGFTADQIDATKAESERIRADIEETRASIERGARSVPKERRFRL